jgi:hypothetical protein
MAPQVTAGVGTVSRMTAQPTSTPRPGEPYGAIRRDGEQAEIEAVIAAHREWVASGRPGAVSHEEAMAELLGGR